MTLKYLSSAAFAAISSIACAGTMGPVCSTDKVGLSCDTGWSIGVQALYLQPTYGDDFRFIGYNINGTTQSYVENAPDWSWGFKLEGLYHFETGNDVDLNWYHLNGQSTDFFTTNTFYPVTFNNTISVKPRWDAVNLEFGKPINIGTFKKIRVHAGAQYAYIKTSALFNGFTDPTLTNTPYSANIEDRFQGVGPRIGADLGYDFADNWGVYAKLATALLAGNSSMNGIISGANTPAVFSLSKTVVAPEVEAKLGINYSFNLAQNALTLDAGYMWVNYFNAQQTDYLFEPDNNLSLQGPYAGLTWVGNL